MAHPALPQPEPSLPPGRLDRLAAAITAVVRALRRTAAIEQADDLFDRLASQDTFLDHTWPGTHPTTSAEEARERALQIREKTLRSQARITAAHGWTGVLSKALAAIASATSITALVLHAAGVF
jgi:hypothetical protein